MLNQQVSAQAAMVAYVDDFKLMMIITLCAIPLLAFMSPPKRGGAPSGDHAPVME